ncbi:unnamed protein product, partial [Ectocarpus sp. 6 AP-2014]
MYDFEHPPPSFPHDAHATRTPSEMTYYPIFKTNVSSQACPAANKKHLQPLRSEEEGEGGVERWAVPLGPFSTSEQPKRVPLLPAALPRAPHAAVRASRLLAGGANLPAGRTALAARRPASIRSRG